MILVIGGTGKIGSEVVKSLAEKKVKTRVLVRNLQKGAEAEKLGLETALGDVAQIATIEAALKGVDQLFLLTVPSPNQSALEIAVVDEAKKSGVKHVVLISAVGVTVDSPISIIRKHAESELHLKKSGLSWTILQPHSFMQNLLGQAGAIKTQGVFYGNYKDGKMPLVDVRDIAAVAVAALTEAGHEGKTYVVTGGEALTYTEVAEKISVIVGKKVAYVDMPTAGIAQVMTSMGMPDWLANDLAKLGEVFSAGHGAVPTDVVEKVTKKKPVTVDRFLRDNAAAFQ